MKVLFAVNDENISTSIVKKYQKQYKEIISYQNVYYFNAILKELQRNKSYDRIVIGEDLEEFSSSSYTQKDKFIFEKLDNISDEAVTTLGTDIPIILICSERRTKSEDILIKLFGIGVYNAIIGNDRSIDEVCRLINKPRSKKEAKIYYKIDTDNVNYEKTSENDVSEVELHNILSHFKKLGTNEKKYVESFNNIVSQYNETQLKVIIAVLPENVKDVLSENSTQYMKLVKHSKSKAAKSNKSNGNKRKVEDEKKTSEKFLDVGDGNLNRKLSKPVVVPKNLDKNIYGEVSKKEKIEWDNDFEEDEEDVDVLVEKTRKRGRPSKQEKIQDEAKEQVATKKRGRGRPRKQPVEEEFEDIEDDSAEYSEFDEPSNQRKNKTKTNDEDMGSLMLPGFDDYDLDDIDDDIDDDDKIKEENYVNKDKKNLEHYDELDSDDDYYYDDDDEEYDDQERDENEVRSSRHEERKNKYEFEEEDETDDEDEEEYDSIIDDERFARLLTDDKKIIAFVGTSKNGTSFIINNVAQELAEKGIDTAIFDATKNKNSYYIYTKNDDNLRKTAVNSLENLKNERAIGIQVEKNLTVYTNLPAQNNELKHTRPILETLAKTHTIVLIDCDFETPLEYFNRAQELYLIQTMDVLTIQPLTAFLRELKVKGILDERKIRIVLNKLLNIRGVSSRNIVAGMSNYNDPEMAFMTELFDRNLVKVAAQIPFDEDVYAKYLEGLIECEIKIKSYPKVFKQKLNELALAIYPLADVNSRNNKKTKKEAVQYSNSFSSDMNDTLNNMRKRY